MSKTSAAGVQRVLRAGAMVVLRVVARAWPVGKNKVKWSNATPQASWLRETVPHDRCEFVVDGRAAVMLNTSPTRGEEISTSGREPPRAADSRRAVPRRARHGG